MIEGFEEAIASARPGDILVAWHLDRVKRNVHYFTKSVNKFKQREISFKTFKDVTILQVN